MKGRRAPRHFATVGGIFDARARVVPTDTEEDAQHACPLLWRCCGGEHTHLVPLCTPGLNVAVGGVPRFSSQVLVLFLPGRRAGGLAEVHVHDRGHLCTRNATLRLGVRRG